MAEPAEVAIAIREHYLPRGGGDALPETHAGLAVAIADKLDTLAGIFAINEKPTGTKDPFGLRRAALGVVRILIEKRLDLDLRGLIELALTNVRADIADVRSRLANPAVNPAAAKTSGVPADTAGQVYEFMMERLRAYYLEPAVAASGAAFTTEMFDAVLATRPGSPLDFDARLKALSAFLELPEATSLAAANKRIANILRKSGQSNACAGGCREPARRRGDPAV